MARGVLTAPLRSAARAARHGLDGILAARVPVSPAPTLIFLHIPKTGGITLRGIIRRQYRRDTFFTLDRFRRTLVSGGPGQLDAARVRVVSGHVAFGFHDQVPWPSAYVTLLRHPVDRMVSLYHYVAREPRNQAHRRVREGGLGLAELVTGGFLMDTDNDQTRRVSGVPFEIGRCTPQILKAAKRNLRDRFAVVGTAEWFDESLLLMKRAFGWRNVYYTRANVTPRRPAGESLPEETLGAIRDANRYDLELYAFAEGLLREALDREGSDFPADLDRFRRWNRRYGIVAPAAGALARGARRLV